MPTSLKYPIAVCIFLILLGTVSSNATPQAFLEGQLKILSRSPVKLADENTAAVAAKNYADYPLIILSRADKKEITRVTADRDGNYRVALPPGDYILDVQRRKPGFVRATAQPFTIVSNHTVRVDMHIDTDHSRS